MPGADAFASGQSGWFAIDPAQVLWHGGGKLQAPRRIAEDVANACIGDSADYYIRRDGTLWVKGLAHRGQYGDGRLTATADFVNTAGDAVAVKAHTGHALYLSQGGVVMGTGGNRYGPLGAHGRGQGRSLGRVFDGARAIATGSRHSAAIRTDGTLRALGGGFGIEPRRLLEGVVAVAAGNTATIALRRRQPPAMGRWRRTAPLAWALKGQQLQQLRVRTQSERQCSRRTPRHASCPHPQPIMIPRHRPRA